MNAQLQAAHDALIQTPEFAAFLDARGQVENLPYNHTLLRAALLQTEAKEWLTGTPSAADIAHARIVVEVQAAPKRLQMRNEDVYHAMPDDRELTNYK